MVTGIMSSIANFATLIVNSPDFTRFATRPKDALWSQLVTIPLGFAITSLIGIIVASSTALIFDSEPVWDPVSVLEKFNEDGGSGQRFGVFVIGTAFALAQLGTNIAANSVSAGTDMTALLPRYLTIVRFWCFKISSAISCHAISHTLSHTLTHNSASRRLYLRSYRPRHTTLRAPQRFQQFHILSLGLQRVSQFHCWGDAC